MPDDIESISRPEPATPQPAVSNEAMEVMKRDWPETVKLVRRLRQQVADAERENERMRKALRPFAKYAKKWEGCIDENVSAVYHKEAGVPTIGDCRRAAEVMDETQ